MGRLFLVRNILELLSGIEPTCTQSEDGGQYVVGVGLVPTTNKMVDENKGKKGKEHGLSCGINRNNTVTKEIWIVSWKGKKGEKKKKVTFERREKVEYIQ